MAALTAGAGVAAQGLRASARLALQRPDPQVGTIGPGGIAGPGGPGALPPQGPPATNGGRGAAEQARGGVPAQSDGGGA
jgi:hypothetical protein